MTSASTDPHDRQHATVLVVSYCHNPAQRLKRVFNIDIETCEAGGGTVKIIAGIEDRAAIQRIPSLSPLLAENRRTLSTRCLKHLDVCFREDCRPNL